MKRWIRGNVGNKTFQLLVDVTNASKRFLAVVGIIGMLWSYVPWQQIQAEVIDEPTDNIVDVQEEPILPSYPTTTDPDFDPSSVAIKEEVVTKRTADSKTFLKVDGTYEVALYNDVIHYHDEGEWKDIDNSLVDKGQYLETKSNAFHVTFPKQLASDQDIVLRDDMYEISWTVLDSTRSSVSYQSEKVTPSNIKELNTINEVVHYQNVLHNVDLEYVITGSSVKENIIMHEYSKNFQLSFLYDVQGLRIVDDGDGHIDFVNEQNDVVFQLDDLWMIDDKQQESFDVDYTLVQQKDGAYVITIIPDDTWLQSAVYPVVIDPSITITGVGASGIRDKYTWNTGSSETTNYLKVGGYYSTEYKSYIEIDTSVIPDDVIVTYSHLQLRTYYGSTYNKCDIFSCQINVRKVNSTSNWSNIINSSFSDVSSTIIDYEYVYPSDTGVEYYHWDITKVLHDWISDSQTLGILELRKQTVLNNDHMYFASENYSTSMGPNVTIGYQSTTGIYDYWTYHSVPVGDAGTAMIGDYTGELSVVRNDYTGSHGGFVIDFGMFYNENLKDTNIGFGNGWRSNYNATVEDNGTEFLITNPDGSETEYAYIPCDDATDEPEIRDVTPTLTCYLSDNGNRTILVEQSLTDRFDLDGDSSTVDFVSVIAVYSTNRVRQLFYNNKLYAIEDLRTGQYLLVEYDSGDISKVHDFYGNYIEFHYSSGSLNYVSSQLCQWDSQTSSCGSYVLVEVIEYEYDSGDTTDITYHMDYSGTDTYEDVFYPGTQLFDDFVRSGSDRRYLISYDYDASSKLVKMTSSDGFEASFEYNNSFQVDHYEYKNGSNNLGYIDISYDTQETTFTDFKGNEVRYLFDFYGHTVNIMDDKGNATYYRFLNPWSNTIESSNLFLNHKLVSSSKPQKTQINPITNHSFERSSPSLDPNWDFVIDDDAGFFKDPVALYSDAHGMIGNQSLRITVYPNQEAHLEQDIILDNNNPSGNSSYTVSAYIYADTSTNARIGVTIDGTTTYSSKVTTLGEWTYVEVDFTISTDNETVTIELENSVSGIAYYDNIQISETYIETRENLIDNPSFEQNSTGWTLYNATRVYDFDESGDDDNTWSQLHDAVLGDYYMRIIGDADTLKYFETTLDTDDFTDESFYIVAGWAKGTVTPNKYNLDHDDGRYYGIIVELYDGLTKEDEVYFPFDSTIEDWQYQSNKVYVENDIDSIKIRVVYRGEGTAYFDGIQFYNEAFGRDYYYDSFGNPEFVQTADKPGLFEYHYESGDRFLLDYTVDQHGKTTNSIYDSNGLLSDVSQNNVASSVSRNTDGSISSMEIGQDSNGDGTIDGAYFENDITYSTNGQYTDNVTDEFGNSTDFDINSLNTLLEEITNANNVSTAFEYDAKGRLTEKSTGNSTITYNYGTHHLEEVVFNGMTYQITYDDLGRIEEVEVGSGTGAGFSGDSLRSFTYEEDVEDSVTYDTGRLSEQVYGNGDKIKFEYDSEDRLNEIYYWDGDSSYDLRFEYEYNQSGILTVVKDHQSNMEYYYSYDIMSRVKKITSQEGDVISYDYDVDGQLHIYTYDIADYERSVQYVYNHQTGQYTNTQYQIETNERVWKTFSYSSNGLKHLTGTTLYIDPGTPQNSYDDTLLNTVTITYFSGTEVTNGTISNRVKSISQSFDNGTYTETLEYTDLGFISKISNNGNDTEYYYNNLNQLTRENNEIEDYTYKYSYDDYGNLETKKYYDFVSGNTTVGTLIKQETYSYTSTWKDKVSSIAITFPSYPPANYTLTYTYDTIGNVTDIDDTRGSTYDISFEWEGRNLIEYENGSDTISFTYNQNGIRDSKTVNSTTTSYVLDGTRVLYETDGTNEIYFTYDVNGTPLSMRYNGSEYFYVYNVLGDVIYLLDDTGDAVVSYRYDAYGNIEHQTSGTLAQANPYRYRGYRYDEETKYYYLQSRYYNPETGRFLNADGMLSASGSVLGHNMFAYTENNPVMGIDPNGYRKCLASAVERLDGPGCMGGESPGGGWGPNINNSVPTIESIMQEFIGSQGGIEIIDGLSIFYYSLSKRYELKGTTENVGVWAGLHGKGSLINYTKNWEHFRLVIDIGTLSGRVGLAAGAHSSASLDAYIGKARYTFYQDFELYGKNYRFEVGLTLSLKAQDLESWDTFKSLLMEPFDDATPLNGGWIIRVTERD